MHRIAPSWPKTLFLALAMAGVGLMAWSFGAETASPSPSQTTPAAPIVAKVPAPAPAAPQALEDTTAFADFKRDIYPLFTREVAGDSCVSCQAIRTASRNWCWSGEAADDFRVMLEGGYFFTEGVLPEGSKPCPRVAHKRCNYLRCSRCQSKLNCSTAMQDSWSLGCRMARNSFRPLLKNWWDHAAIARHCGGCVGSGKPGLCTHSCWQDCWRASKNDSWDALPEPLRY